MDTHQTQAAIRRLRGLMNRTEVVATLGIGDPMFRVLAERYPADSHIGERRCWTAETVERMREAITTLETPPHPSTQEAQRRQRGLCNQTEILGQLKIAGNVFKRLRKAVPPDTQIGYTPCWTAESVERMREVLMTPPTPSATVRTEKYRAAGYHTIRSAAAEHEIPLITWRLWINRGDVPKPSHVWVGNPTLRFYSENEAEMYAAMIKFGKRALDQRRNIKMA